MSLITTLLAEELDRVYIGKSILGNSVATETFEGENPARLTERSFFYFGTLTRGALAGYDALRSGIEVWAKGLTNLEAISEIWEKHNYNKPFMISSQSSIIMIKNRYGMGIGFDAQGLCEIYSTPLFLPEFHLVLENRLWVSSVYGIKIRNTELGFNFRFENRALARDIRHPAELQDFRLGDVEQKENYSLSLDLGAKTKTYIFEFELISKNILYKRLWGKLNETYSPIFIGGVSWLSYAGFPPYLIKLKTAIEIYDITNALKISWKRRIRFAVEYIGVRDKLRIFAGITDGYPSLGLRVLLLPICLSYSLTTFERGYEPGQFGLTTHNLELAIAILR